MTDIDHHTGLPSDLPPQLPPQPPPQFPDGAPRTVTHIIYALHAWSAVIGITSAAFIVTAFLAGWPSIIGVILNYAYRSGANGTYLESHFRWQIRTFWFALLWVLIGVVPFITFIGIPVAVGIWVVTGLWVVYRIGRGWIALADGKSVGKPLPA